MVEEEVRDAKYEDISMAGYLNLELWRYVLTKAPVLSGGALVARGVRSSPQFVASGIVQGISRMSTHTDAAIDR